MLALENGSLVKTTGVGTGDAVGLGRFREGRRQTIIGAATAVGMQHIAYQAGDLRSMVINNQMKLSITHTVKTVSEPGIGEPTYI